MLNIKNHQRELDSAKPGKRILQAERGEILYREDIKTSFAYAIVGLTVTIGLAGIGYLFIQQIKK